MLTSNKHHDPSARQQDNILLLLFCFKLVFSYIPINLACNRPSIFSTFCSDIFLNKNSIMISKEPLSRPTPLPSSVRASRPKALRVIILTVLCVFGWHVFTHERYSPWRLGARPAAEQKEFSWKDVSRGI